MTKRIDVFGWGFIGLLGAILIYVVAGTLEPHVTNAGDTAPNFKITADNGKTITRDDFGGKLLVLNFWASWCPPCVTETPSLEQFAQTMAPQGVVVVAISQDRKEEQYKKFIERYKITFETARDPGADIAASYGTFQIPETYLIGRDGKVIEKVISNQDWMDPEFLSHVRKMIGAAPVSGT